MKRLLCTVALVGCLGLIAPGLTIAQDGKLLDDYARRAEIAKQALQATVDGALQRAGKLSPDLALIALEKAEDDVSNAPYLTPAEKKTLLDKLTAKKKVVSIAGQPANSDASNRAPRTDRATDDYIQNELSAIRSLEQQGQYGNANARRRALADRYPTHPALTAQASVGSRHDFLRDSERLRGQRESAARAIQSDREKSAGNVTADVKYDKEHWEKIKDRPEAGSINFTKRERDLLNKLDERTTEDTVFNNSSFDQVLKSLEKELGIPLVIGKATMDEVRVGYDTVVTHQMPKGVSKRTLLRSILAELGLTYLIKAETLQIVSVLQAKNEMRVGIMDVGTLLNGRGSPDELIRMIKSQVEPDSWDTGGGNGSITYVAPGTLIIKNSAEVIHRLGARSKR
jgi:hypothetical protein